MAARQEERTDMHRLDRNSVTAPSCIMPHDPARHYSTLRGSHKAEIRTALLTLQQNRCAYCERRTGTGENDGHIEHFHRQTDFPARSTDWTNLFWSCTDPNFCGKHKDECRISGSTGKCRPVVMDDVIKPCTDDPDQFMHFISDGAIQPRAKLTPAEKHRYDETLRVFQLAEAAFLVDSRRDAVKPYIDALSELMPDGPERVRAYIDRQLARVRSVPFETVIRHFLLSNQP
jgi:uncharacterized protein (TIGR02646 family)